MNLAWSPDGKSVPFESSENPLIEEALLTGTTISTGNIHTGEIKELCTIMNELVDLTWAPDHCNLNVFRDVISQNFAFLGIMQVSGQQTGTPLGPPSC